MPTRLAVLDRRFTILAGRLPEVTTEIVSRAVRRSRWLGLHLAIRCLRRVDARLLVLFWHLAERWGRVTRHGIVLPLSLTHELLARLVGAQRPSVTTALGELAERGVAVRRDGGWLLTAELPELLERIYAGRPAPRVADAQESSRGSALAPEAPAGDRRFAPSAGAPFSGARRRSGTTPWSTLHARRRCPDRDGAIVLNRADIGATIAAGRDAASALRRRVARHDRLRGPG